MPDDEDEGQRRDAPPLDPTATPEALVAAVLATRSDWQGDARAGAEPHLFFQQPRTSRAHLVVGIGGGWLGLTVAWVMSSTPYGIGAGLFIAAVALWHVYRTRTVPAYACWILSSEVRMQLVTRRVLAYGPVARVRAVQHHLEHGRASTQWSVEVRPRDARFWRRVSPVLAASTARALAQAIAVTTGAALESADAAREPGT